MQRPHLSSTPLPPPFVPTGRPLPLAPPAPRPLAAPAVGQPAGRLHQAGPTSAKAWVVAAVVAVIGVVAIGAGRSGSASSGADSGSMSGVDVPSGEDDDWTWSEGPGGAYAGGDGEHTYFSDPDSGCSIFDGELICP